MDGMDIAIVVAVILLIGFAVAAGLQLAQQRAVLRLAAARRGAPVSHPEVRTPSVCAECGADLHPRC